MKGGGLGPMIAGENQSSLRAGSRLGQNEEAAGDGSVGGGNGGGGEAATTTSEPGERANYAARLRSSRRGCSGIGDPPLDTLATSARNERP